MITVLQYKTNFPPSIPLSTPAQNTFSRCTSSSWPSVCNKERTQGNCCHCGALPSGLSAGGARGTSSPVISVSPTDIRDDAFNQQYTLSRPLSRPSTSQSAKSDRKHAFPRCILPLCIPQLPPEVCNSEYLLSSLSRR